MPMLPYVFEKMNPVAKDLWIARLRKKNVKQALGALRRKGGGRCCLGHLCDVAKESGVVVEIELNPVDGEYSYSGESGSLPEAVRIWAGFRIDDPHIMVDGEGAPVSASQANDEHQLSLKKIANEIEKNL